MKILGKQERKGRGFPIVEFEDYYGLQCSMQATSLAVYQQPGTSAIWLGVDNVCPQVMAAHAAAVGVKTDKTTGWVPFPIPSEVLVSSRMHLDRGQVEALIGHLQSWLDTGNFVCEVKK